LQKIKNKQALSAGVNATESKVEKVAKKAAQAVMQDKE